MYLVTCVSLCDPRCTCSTWDNNNNCTCIKLHMFTGRCHSLSLILRSHSVIRSSFTHSLCSLFPVRSESSYLLPLHSFSLIPRPTSLLPLSLSPTYCSDPLPRHRDANKNKCTCKWYVYVWGYMYVYTTSTCDIPHVKNECTHVPIQSAVMQLVQHKIHNMYT